MTVLKCVIGKQYRYIENTYEILMKENWKLYNNYIYVLTEATETLAIF